MGSWEDELDLDLSELWVAGSKPQQVETKPTNPDEGGVQGRGDEDGGDDLTFPSQAATALHVSQPALAGQSDTRVSGLEPEVGAMLLLDADVADAPTQVASLTAEPFISRGVPLVTQHHLGSQNGSRMPPLPSFQPVVCQEGSTVDIATQTLASRENDHKQRLPTLQVPGLRNPNSHKGSQQLGADIRKYFSQKGASSSGANDGGGPRKKPRIPGPVGEVFRKGQHDEGDAADGDGDGNAVGDGEDDFNDRVFRKGAWITALQSLNVEEFDPARYAILKVTASNIVSSRIQHHVPHFVAVIKELTHNVFGDAAVILKDPTGTVAGMMNNKVFSNTDYARAISPGAVIVLKQVSIFSPSAHYLNITINNVVQVFAANTGLPQAKQEPLEPLPQPRSQPRSQPQPQPQPEPSPPQHEQPPKPRSQLPSQPLPVQPQPQPKSQPRPPPSPPQEPTNAPDGIVAAANAASWDLIPPSPSPPREPTNAPDGIVAAANAASWDLIPPSPSPPREPSPPQEPKAPEGIAAAVKMAGWGDLTDDMEALLNEDVDNFYK